MVIQWLHKNTTLAQNILIEAIPRVAKLTDAKAHEALKYAILTHPERALAESNRPKSSR